MTVALRIACSLLVAGLFGAPPARAQQRRLPAIAEAPAERYALGNGLRVVLQHDARQATVAGAVAYRAGTRDDPPGYGGLAHLVEHMTFRGSRNLPRRAGMKHYDSIGARVNGTTLRDATVYFAEFPARHLPHFLWIESDRMGFVAETISEAELEIERRVVRNEYRERAFQRRISAIIQQTATPAGHPYHHVADDPVDPDELGLDDVRWFLQRHYRPDNATLVLVGNLDIPRTRDLIERYFGPLRAAGRPAPRPPAGAIAFAGRQRLRFEAKGGLATLLVRWSVPCGDEVGCHARLRLLAPMIEQAVTESTRAAGLTTDVDVTLRSHEQHTDFELNAHLTSETAADRVLQQIDRELERLRRGRIDESELRAAQFAHATRMLYEQESLARRAFAFVLEPDVSAAATVDASLRLRVREVAAAAARLLPPNRRLVVHIERSASADYEGELDDSDGRLSPRVVPPMRAGASEAPR